MRRRGTLFAFAVAMLTTAGSLIGCHDTPTWMMETAPTWLAAAYLAWSWKRFPWSDVVVGVLTVHAVVLAVGGHYTYAHVPVGFWAKDVFDLSRNHYDRLGHFLQGVTPTLLVHEALVRTTSLRGGWWLATLSIAAALAFSAIYELIEWLAATVLGQGADAFLGSQGDVWDTQADMLCALLGALFATVILFPYQRARMQRLVSVEPTFHG